MMRENPVQIQPDLEENQILQREHQHFLSFPFLALFQLFLFFPFHSEILNNESAFSEKRMKRLVFQVAETPYAKN